MAIEIERKFLVNSSTFKGDAVRSYRIIQGFLSKDPERTVRIRLLDDKGNLTVKGLGDSSGISRFEWERELSKSDAEALLKLCLPGIIDKERFEIRAEDLLYEVDVFYSDNEGLIVAEIELPHADASFHKPTWLGEEVTGDSRYYNSYLSEHPFNTWT